MPLADPLFRQLTQAGAGYLAFMTRFSTIA
jgi:hypothetical protein